MHTKVWVNIVNSDKKSATVNCHQGPPHPSSTLPTLPQTYGRTSCLMSSGGGINCYLFRYNWRHHFKHFLVKTLFTEYLSPLVNSLRFSLTFLISTQFFLLPGIARTNCWPVSSITKCFTFLFLSFINETALQYHEWIRNDVCCILA